MRKPSAELVSQTRTRGKETQDWHFTQVRGESLPERK